jgi:hypothetical protein
MTINEKFCLVGKLLFSENEILGWFSIKLKLQSNPIPYQTKGAKHRLQKKINGTS